MTRKNVGRLFVLFLIGLGLIQPASASAIGFKNTKVAAQVAAEMETMREALAPPLVTVKKPAPCVVMANGQFFDNLQVAIDSSPVDPYDRLYVRLEAGAECDGFVANRDLLISGGHLFSGPERKGERSTITGRGVRRAIQITQQSDGQRPLVYLEDLVITGGNAGTGFGGGIDAHTADVQVHNSIVENNTARWGGGARGYNGSLHIRNSVFRNNTAEEGSALMCNACASVGSISTSNVERSWFLNNNGPAVGGYTGAALSFGEGTEFGMSASVVAKSPLGIRYFNAHGQIAQTTIADMAMGIEFRVEAPYTGLDLLMYYNIIANSSIGAQVTGTQLHMKHTVWSQNTTNVVTGTDGFWDHSGDRFGRVFFTNAQAGDYSLIPAQNGVVNAACDMPINAVYYGTYDIVMRRRVVIGPDVPGALGPDAGAYEDCVERVYAPGIVAPRK